MARRKLAEDGGRATLTTSAYDNIRTDIVSCILEPGVKLRIEALKERYVLGTSPIREALNRLSTEGLVKQIDQRGFVVAPVSLEELSELTESRCLLYERLLPLSIERGDAQWEECIILAHHRLSRVKWETGEPPRLNPDAQRAHREFHRSLLAACGLPMLLNYLDTQFDLSDRYRVLSQRVRTAGSRDIEGEHAGLVDAVINRRPAEAVERALCHVRETAQRVALLFPRAAAA